MRTEFEIPPQECIEAWEILKTALYDAPTLAYPDYTKPFLLYTDRLKERGYGAALYQVAEDGVERPILYISKALAKYKQNY